MPIIKDLTEEYTLDPKIIQENPSNNPDTYASGISLESRIDPNAIIFNVIVIIIWAVGIAAVISFLYAGFKYITAGGDAEKTESAKKIIIGSIIGMIIIMFSYVVYHNAVELLSDNSKSPQEIINQEF